MNILLIPNSLKGSLSARDFCKQAAKNKSKQNAFEFMPVSDGGDGILDVFAAAYPKAKKHSVVVIDAVYTIRTAPYLILPDGKTCIIETAKICGLGYLKKEQLNPLGATSFGVGQVIKAAIKRGAKTFYIGLGGVACNDCGAGMAAALGYELYDDEGQQIPLGAKSLLDLRSIGKTPALLKGIKFIGLSDVTNPLLGKDGSAQVYGPQKGANPAQVKILEQALANCCAVVKKSLKRNINKPRCGAAGAIAAGLHGFLGADLEDGGSFILNKLNAVEKIKNCDLVITAEGKLDEQTFYGKAPLAVCKLAKKYKKPVVFICGINEIKDFSLLKKHNIVKVIELADFAGSAEESFKNAAKYISAAMKEAIK